jgi:signal transduction histidine kinase/DNA-binding response OmpR family regulator
LTDTGPEGHYATVVLNPNIQGLSGNDLAIDLKDSNGNFFIRNLQQQIDSEGEAIIRFTFRNPNTNRELSKISFYKKYPGWKWLVGSGFYPKDLQKTILENKKVLQSRLKIEVLIILAAFAAVFLLALLVANIFAKTIKREFKIFTNFFKESALKHELLSKEKLAVEEFRELADSANIMIQAKKEGEDALVEAKEIAVAATQAKTEFLANMSHEIRTPMNTIIGMIDVLLKSKLDAKEKEYIEIIKVSTNNLLTIINDILDISKIEAGKFDLEMKPFSIRRVVENVADMISIRAHRQGLELITLIETDVPRVLVGDPTHLSQVLLNLANNAVKFTEDGEIFISVELLERLNGDIKLVFKVKDTGIGIAGESMEKLFRTFSQVDGSKSRKYKGTGLGLYISKQLIRLMGGDIGVESEEGKGSTFWFTAVFKTAEDQESALPGDNLPFKDRQVMLVDENDTSLQIFKKQLESWGFTCLTQRSWPEARKLLDEGVEKGKPIDIVLLNLDIRTQSFKDLVSAVKNKRMPAETKLVLIASKITPYEDDEMLVLGFDKILKKPVKERDLLEALGSALKVESLPDGGEEWDEVRPDTIDANDLHLKVLLVEDHGFNREVVKLNLEQFGFQVVVAENGEDAIEKFKNSHFDLILMDVHMEVMDGNEATRHIREMEKDRLNIFGKVTRTPIIAMTADVTKESINESKKAGMTDFVGKPFTTAKMVRVIRKVMKKDLKQLKIDQIEKVEVKFRGDSVMRDSIIKNLMAMGIQNQATIDKVITKGKKSIEEGLLLSDQDIEQHESSHFLSHIHNVKGILLNLGLNEFADEIKQLEEHVKVSQLDVKAKDNFFTLKEKLIQLISKL